MYQLHKDDLRLIAERFGRTLATDHLTDMEWAEAVNNSLARVIKALRQQMAFADNPDGLLSEVDDTRPTLARQAGDFCRSQGKLLRQAHGLQAYFRIAFGGNTTGQPDARTALNRGTVRQQTAALLSGLQGLKQAENLLILESVNTDIGVGD